MPRKGGALYDARRMLPRMSWHPRNLFCLHERSLGQRVNDTSFRSSNKTVYWQRSRSKALLRGYHGDWIREKKFKQHWLPASLPTVRNACQPGSDVPHTPVTSMMWAELEKRLDVAIFRACLVESVYEARRLVIHGRVRLNGAKCTDAWTRLASGDLVSVEAGALGVLDDRKPQPGRPRTGTDQVGDAGGQAAPAAPPGPRTFRLPPFAAPFLFVPPYLEVSFRLASFVFIRPPTCGPGYSEIPSPWDADGEVVRLAWEWYNKQGHGRRVRSQRRDEDRTRQDLRDPLSIEHVRLGDAGGRASTRRVKARRLGIAIRGPQSDPNARRRPTAAASL